MHVYKPNTDQEVTLQLCANRRPCAEYHMPSQPNPDINVAECFVPVKLGDEITLRGIVSGSVLHGSFDLIVDGSFLSDKRIEGGKNGSVRCYTDRKLEFRAIFDAPKPSGHKGMDLPEKVIDGWLHVKELTDHSEFPGTMEPVGGIGVGSVVVLIQFNQRADEAYTDRYRSITCGDVDIDRGEVWSGGIVPEFELEVRPMAGTVTENRQVKHKRHAEQIRFGEKPWAKMVWYYRSQEAIDEAGCVALDEDESHVLEAGDASTFIKGVPPTNYRAKKEDDEASSPEGSGLFVTPTPGQETATPAPSERKDSSSRARSRAETGSSSSKKRPAAAMSPAAPSPAATTPRPRLGGPLILPPGWKSAHAQSSPVVGRKDEFTEALEEYNASRRASDDRRRVREAKDRGERAGSQDSDGLFVSNGDGLVQTDGGADQPVGGDDEPDGLNVDFDEGPAQHEMTGFPDDGEASPGLENMNEADLADAMAEARTYLDGDVPTPQTAPVAQMSAQAEAEAGHGAAEMQPGGHEDAELQDVEQAAEHVKDEKVKEEEQQTPPPEAAAQDLDTAAPTDNANAADAPADAIEQTDENIMDQIRDSIPDEGVNINNLWCEFADEQTQNNEDARKHFFRLMKKVAYQKQPGTEPENPWWHLKPSQMDEVRQSVEQDPADTATAAAGAEEVKPEQEEEAALRGSVAPEPAADAEIPVASPATPAPASKKRPASSASNSGNSTPSSKKARLDPHAAKRAELKRKKEENEKRKAAAKAAAHASRASRQEMERLQKEKEDRELEELEKEMAEDDAETERLEAEAREEAELEKEAREELEGM